jgi:large subunit ribosomal protein L9
MQVILKKNHENLGNQGDTLTVAEGYYRNFLAPQGLAVTATPANKVHFETIIKQRAKKIVKEKVEQEGLSKQLEHKVVVIKAKAGANKKLFGSVNSRQIAAAIKESLNLEVSSKRVRIAEPIRSEGEYTVSVKLYHGVNAKIKIKVEAVIDTEDDAIEKMEISRKKRRAILLDVVSKLDPQDESGYIGLQLSTGIEGEADLTTKVPERKKRRDAEAGEGASDAVSDKAEEKEFIAKRSKKKVEEEEESPPAP